MLETQDRGWGLNYYRKLGEGAFKEYCQLYYGYYFHVLHDRMAAAIAGKPAARKLYVQVGTRSLFHFLDVWVLYLGARQRSG